MREDCLQLYVTIPIVMNSLELMDFMESVAAFQLLQSEKAHLVEGMGKSFLDD